jgi:hypothetical protein
MKKEKAKNKIFWDVTTCSLARNLPTIRADTPPPPFSTPKLEAVRHSKTANFYHTARHCIPVKVTFTATAGVVHLTTMSVEQSYVAFTDCMIWNKELQRVWKEVLIS